MAGNDGQTKTAGQAPIRLLTRISRILGGQVRFPPLPLEGNRCKQRVGRPDRRAPIRVRRPRVRDSCASGSDSSSRRAPWGRSWRRRGWRRCRRRPGGRVPRWRAGRSAQLEVSSGHQLRVDAPVAAARVPARCLRSWKCRLVAPTCSAALRKTPRPVLGPGAPFSPVNTREVGSGATKATKCSSRIRTSSVGRPKVRAPRRTSVERRDSPFRGALLAGSLDHAWVREDQPVRDCGAHDRAEEAVGLGCGGLRFGSDVRVPPTHGRCCHLGEGDRLEGREHAAVEQAAGQEAFVAGMVLT
jgi:hypothetical protein